MWPVSVNVCVSVYLFTLESGHHRAKEAVPVGEVCNSSLRRCRENKHALTHTCWQWRVINIWAEDVFGLREEGRVARGTCTGQPSPESPVAASFPCLPSTTKDHFAHCIFNGDFLDCFPHFWTSFLHLVSDTPAHVPTFHPAAGLPPTLTKCHTMPLTGGSGGQSPTSNCSTAFHSRVQIRK